MKKNKPVYVLGISCYYHDAAAALLRDGVVVAAAEEERFSRKKHDQSFPRQAIDFCLQLAGISGVDLDYVGFYEKPLIKFERVLFQTLETFPKSFKVFVNIMPGWLTEKLNIIKTIRKELGYSRDIFFVPHHLAHAAGAFFLSAFERAAVVTIDGVGEWTTTACGRCFGKEIILQKEIRFPHSLGLLYSTITAYLGFKVNDAEYKVMGLAAFGNMDREVNDYYKRLQSIIDIKEDGSFRLDLSYFRFHYIDRMPSKKLFSLLGGSPRRAEEAISKRHQDIAAAMQLVYEDVFLKILNYTQRLTGEDKLVLSGGVIQNSVANGKIFSHTPFRDVFIPSSTTDAGASLGAALYLYHSILRQPRVRYFSTAYLGSNYGHDEIQKLLDHKKIYYIFFNDDQEFIGKVAELLADNYFVGWFDGPMEFGPRALGARSILANPANPLMKDILNKKIKRREAFRPFAPAVCAEDAGKFFEIDMPLPACTDFMTMVYPIRKKFRQALPAVTHVDGTGRLQTVSRDQHQRYYDLIKAFGRLSGVPVLLNTSFNLAGEPIVCTPDDALNCLARTEIDYLAIGHFLIKRSDNLNYEN